MIKVDSQKAANNVVMLYIMNIAQIVMPLITLPYLARVLSVDNYGIVSYVKSIMVYANLIMQFGFLLSGTRKIVEAKGNLKKIGKVVGCLTQARLFLSVISLIVLVLMIANIKILRSNALFTLLMFVPIFLDTFLFEFLFRGLEKMHIITLRYLITKSISAILTFVVIRKSSDMLLIPTLDIFASIVAIILIQFELKKLHIKIYRDSLRNTMNALHESFVYFISEMSSTVFNALNTVLVGIFLSSRDVAFWGLTLSFIGAVQSMYYPVSDGIYPEMVKNHNIKLFNKFLLIFTPLILIGCLIVFFGSSVLMFITGGSKYVKAAYLLRLSTPLLFLLFYSILCGWPLLGSINKNKEVTFTTILGALFQILGLLILIITHNFNLVSVLVIRTLSEGVILLSRLILFWKYRSMFNLYGE